MEAVYMNKKFNEILYDALQEQKEMEKREKIYKEKDMGKLKIEYVPTESLKTYVNNAI